MKESKIDIEPWQDYLQAFDGALRGQKGARATMQTKLNKKVSRDRRKNLSKCKCNKHMIQLANEGTCLWCGHGNADLVSEHAFRLNMAASTTAKFDARIVSNQSKSNGYRGGCSAVWSEDDCIKAAREWEENYGSLPKSYDWTQHKNGFNRPSYQTIRKVFGGWRGFMRAIAEVPKDQAI